VINTIVKKDGLTFKDIEKEIFKFVCELGVSITQEFLKGYDKQLMEERDKKEYRHKGYRPDHIGQLIYR